VSVLQVQLGNEPPKQKQNKERHDDFYANVGDAIRTLRDDIPDLFGEDLNCASLFPDIASFHASFRASLNASCALALVVRNSSACRGIAHQMRLQMHCGCKLMLRIAGSVARVCRY
jgi:hypothetical protein